MDVIMGGFWGKLPNPFEWDDTPTLTVSTLFH
jgi:hypothetical protein